jgi:hypothetical protein
MPSATPPRRSPLAARVALALGAVLATLLVAELACRVQAHLDNQRTLEVASSKPRSAIEGRRVAMIDVIRTSPDDRIVFELKPGMRDVPFKGAPLSTNRFGFRGPDVPVEEGPDTVTIVGLGDSVMFGYGVADGMDYLSILERLLRQRHPGKDWRCINTAVPAYNTVMEVHTLRTKALRFGPDLVILGLVVNDLGLPPYMRVVDDVFDPARSFLYERFARGVHRAFGSDPSPDRDPRLLAHDGFEDESRIPERYRPLVGWEPFVGALHELDALSKQHGFEVVSFTNTEGQLVQQMQEEVARLGWLQVRLMPEIQQYLAEHHGGYFSMGEPEVYLASELAVSPGVDGHPSVLQHWMAAEKLFRELERAGVIERLMR